MHAKHALQWISREKEIDRPQITSKITFLQINYELCDIMLAKVRVSELITENTGRSKPLYTSYGKNQGKTRYHAL